MTASTLTRVIAACTLVTYYCASLSCRFTDIGWGRLVFKNRLPTVAITSLVLRGILYIGIVHPWDRHSSPGIVLGGYNITGHRLLRGSLFIPIAAVFLPLSENELLDLQRFWQRSCIKLLKPLLYYVCECIYEVVYGFNSISESLLLKPKNVEKCHQIQWKLQNL